LQLSWGVSRPPSLVSDLTNWRLPAAADNAHALRTSFADGFHAIAEFDRIGHLVLHRVGEGGPAPLEQVVGIAMLRRAITVFTALRTLLESSLADPARALARAQFELWLNYRCLAYGSLPEIALETPTESSAREPRARRFFVASERRGLLSRAMILHPASHYAPKSVEDRDALESEMSDELYRLRAQFPAEWAYFGDMKPDATSVIQAVTRDPYWFSAEWPNRSVGSIAQLSYAFGYRWEYDYLYDAYSALVHARGIRHDVAFDEGQMNVRHPNDDAWFLTIGSDPIRWTPSYADRLTCCAFFASFSSYSTGVSYPRLEWRRSRLYQTSMNSKVSRRASSRVAQSLSCTSSTLKVAKKLSVTALSQQFPRRLMLASAPCAVNSARYSADAY
jgi:hypothetical protein